MAGSAGKWDLSRPRRGTAAPRASGIDVHPVTAERWADMMALFERRGPRGGQPVTSACWCMFWRLPTGEFDRGWGKGESRGRGNKVAMEEIVASGRVPGLIAYLGGEPVGWISIAPREEFARLERTRTLRSVDDQPVWSVVCFYIDRRYGGRGIAAALLEGAVNYAREHGAAIVEGYPVRPGDYDPFTGYEAMFAAAGFETVREGTRRSIVRRRIVP